MCRCLRSKRLILLALLGATIFVPVSRAEDAARKPEQIYQAVCRYCHETGLGPQLKARQLPAAYVTHVVRHGQRAMPAFRSTEISDTELQRIAAFIEGSEGGGQ